MKRWIVAAASMLGLSIVAFVAAVIYVDIGRARGERWSSLDGPEPVWPAAVGFGALYAIPLSALVLITLVLVAILRAYLPRSPSDG